MPTTWFLCGRVVWCSLLLGAAVVAFPSYRGSARGIRCLCAVEITEFEGLKGMFGERVECGEGHTRDIWGMHCRFRRCVWTGFG
jgi:hypothetical protein